jgi:hypothetical protein
VRCTLLWSSRQAGMEMMRWRTRGKVLALLSMAWHGMVLRCMGRGADGGVVGARSAF